MNWADPLGEAKVKGVLDVPIYVHPNDADPFPSNPHGHIGNPNSPKKIDINTGNIYSGGKITGETLSKKQLKVFRNKLRVLGYKNFGIILISPGILEDIDRCARAHKNGNTFTEQIKEDLQDAGPLLDTPLGILPNPYYNPYGFL